MSIAEIVESVVEGPLRLRLVAYDGSSLGPPDARRALHLRTPRAASYLATAPGDLGLARAYVTGDLDVEGVHPGDPYDLLVDLASLRFRRPTPAAALEAARTLGVRGADPATPTATGDPAALATGGRGPPALDDPRRRGDQPPLRRLEPVLRDGPGPVDDLHVRVLPRRRRHARAGAGQQVPPRPRQAAALRPGDRLLDIGCGWGGMVRYAARHGIRCRRRHAVAPAGAVGPEGDRRRGARRPRRGAPLRLPRRSARPGSTPCRRSGSPSTSGCATTRPTSAGSATGCAPAGCCSTTASPARTTAARRPGHFIDRYVFPDGELTGSGRIITAAQDVGLEVRARGEPARALRADPGPVVPQPRRALGRVRRRGG